MTFDQIAIRMLATVTGGHHDPTECYDPPPREGISAAPEKPRPPTYVCTPLLDTVTGGSHPPPEPCIREQHPKSIAERLGELGKQLGPWIQLFDR